MVLGVPRFVLDAAAVVGFYLCLLLRLGVLLLLPWWLFHIEGRALHTGSLE